MHKCPHCNAEVSSVKYPNGRVEILNHGELECEVNRLRADAERYRFIRDNLAQCGSPHMDSTFAFRFRMLRGRGRTLDEVIDKLIAENRSHSPPESP